MTKKELLKPKSKKVQLLEPSLYNESKTRELDAFLTKRRGEKHIIVIQDYPDPDAISSAFTHKLISMNYEIEADIVYDGVISHQQNIALVRLLDIDIIKYNENIDLTQYNGFILIDTQGTNSSISKRLLEDNIKPLIIVDHHERQDMFQAVYSDIRKIGATATIYTNHIKSGLLQLMDTNPLHKKVCTALMHGIITETSNLVRAKEEDFLAAGFLSNHYDIEILEQILIQYRSKRVMDIIQKALINREIKENISISGIGYLRTDDRDAIPQAADYLLTEENVHTAIVYGIMSNTKGNEIISGSLRTSKLTLNPDEFLKDVFGKREDGRYFGGGKNLAGGFEIPIGFLSGTGGEEFDDEKWHVFDIQIKQKIFNKVGIEK